MDRVTVKYAVRPEPAHKVKLAKAGFCLSALASLFPMADLTDKKIYVLLDSISVNWPNFNLLLR